MEAPQEVGHLIEDTVCHAPRRVRRQGGVTLDEREHLPAPVIGAEVAGRTIEADVLQM
jgi:hypothetical protein